jgi:hypothetical protein
MALITSCLNNRPEDQVLKIVDPETSDSYQLQPHQFNDGQALVIFEEKSSAASEKT